MASTYISRTFTGTYNKGTISMWLKRSGLGSQYIFYNESSSDSNDYGLIQFDSSDRIEFMTVTNGTHTQKLITNRVFRDTSAFYHFVFAMDTDNSTADNRLRIYVNGVEETSYDTRDNGSQGDTNYMFQTSATNKHRMFASSGGSACFDGLATHIHIVPNSQLAPTVFGETDSTSGIWKPKTSPSVTYTAQGAFLKFENSGNLDLDSSGNNLTFTTSGTLTQSLDTPSNVFACWNPQINTDLTGNWSYAPITFPLSKGKWYSEHMITGGNGYGNIGLSGASYISNIFITGEEPGLSSPSFAFRCINGGIKMNNSNTSYGSAPGTSDAILGMAVDIDNKKVWYSVNGTYVTYGGGVGDPAGGNYGFDWSSLSDDFGWLHVCGDSETNGYGNWKSNFGSGFFGTTAVASANADANGFGAFEYAVPSGYYSICTKNIKEFG